MTETVLHGGDLNIVVRVGETVRRPLGPWSPAVHALLRHFEAVGFDGAPRFLGVDDKGREMLSYIGGEAAVAPVPAGAEVPFTIGSLLRGAHDAQASFVRPIGATWQSMIGGAKGGEVVCHNDLFWPNVIFRAGSPVALIDWDLAAPAPRVHDVASAARFWAPLRPDEQAEAWGLPTESRRQRLLALCDGYELSRGQRAAMLEAVYELGEKWIATYRSWGRDRRFPGWSGMWDRDGDRYLLATQRWLVEHRAEISSWLR